MPDMEDSTLMVNTHLVGGHMDLQLLGFPAVRTSSMRGILQWQYAGSTVCCSPEFPPSFLLGMKGNEHAVADTADWNKPSLTFMFCLFPAPIKSLEQVFWQAQVCSAGT